MKKVLKILILFTIIILTMLILEKTSFAKIDTNDIAIGTTANLNDSVPMTKKVIGLIQPIGSVCSVLALVIIGIKYMLSSVEEQGKMKGVLGYYVVGAVLVFAMSNILSIAYHVVSGITFE